MKGFKEWSEANKDISEQLNPKQKNMIILVSKIVGIFPYEINPWGIIWGKFSKNENKRIDLATSDWVFLHFTFREDEEIFSDYDSGYFISEKCQKHDELYEVGGFCEECLYERKMISPFKYEAISGKYIYDEKRYQEKTSMMKSFEKLSHEDKEKVSSAFNSFCVDVETIARNSESPQKDVVELAQHYEVQLGFDFPTSDYLLLSLGEKVGPGASTGASTQPRKSGYQLTSNFDFNDALTPDHLSITHSPKS